MTTTLAAPTIDSPRAGTLGIGAPRVPTDLGPYSKSSESAQADPLSWRPSGAVVPPVSRAGSYGPADPMGTGSAGAHDIHRAIADLRLAILESRTGHEFEVRAHESRDPDEQWAVIDCDVGDAAAFGRTREDAIENAVEAL